MKSVLKICLISLMSGIIFWSCSSKLSVTKRHYSRGYYVAHTTGKPNTSTKHKKISQVPAKSYRDKNSEVRLDKIENTKEINASSDLIANNNVANRNQSNQTLSNKAEKIYAPALSIKHLTIKTPVQELKRAWLSTKSESAHSDREGLSLFWLVIVIILILWFFGYIAGWGGTGGLINLLLLVALILLILWLLRII